MDKPIRVIDRPRYMQTFACVGAACEEHCCQGWRVFLDRTTYKRYQEIRLDSLRDRLQKHVKKVDAPERSDDRYGLLGLADDGVCPMLNRDSKLCDVQSSLGAEYLSRTCDTYPRTHSQRGRREEEFAHLSCPEAARLALADPAALDLTPTPMLEGAEQPDVEDEDVVRAHAQMLYATARTLIGSKELSASEALIALGLIVRKPRALWETAQPHERGPAFVALMQRMSQPAALASMAASVRALPSSQEFHRAMLQALHEGYVATMSPRPRFKAVLDECATGLGIESGDLNGLVERLDAARRDWFDPVDAAHPWLLKNYLLNDLGRTGFPARDANSVELEYMHLAVRFALIKFYLVGVAAHRREAFGPDDYVRVIQAFSRNVEHSSWFLPHVIERLEKAGLNSVASAALLLR